MEGIFKENKVVLKTIYNSYFPDIRRFILLNKGSDDDARDIFQDALVILFLKVRKNIPTLNCTFGTYLYAICKYLWLKEHRRIGRHAIIGYDLDNYADPSVNIHHEYIQMEKRKLVMEHFEIMAPECKKVLRLFVQDLPVEDIMKEMGYSSLQYARNRRLSCKEKLVRQIWNNPRYKELGNEALRENTAIPRWETGR